MLIQYLQAEHYTAACRAGTFFLGCGLLCSQIFENITQNGFSNGMDIAGLAARFFDMRRGLILVCIIGILIQPWRMLTQAATFLTVLSAFGVFFSAMTGILIADFWVVRKQKLKIPDLYEEHGIYWYTWGINWRAYAVFFVSISISMPGLVATCGGYEIAEPWLRIYYAAYFVGMAMGFILYVIVCHFFPPEGLGIQEELADGFIDGEAHNASVEDMSKTMDASEKAVPV